MKQKLASLTVVNGPYATGFTEYHYKIGVPLKAIRI